MSAPNEPSPGFWRQVKARARAIEDISYDADVKAVANPDAKKWFWRGMLIVAGILVLHLLFLLLWLWRDNLSISEAEAANLRLMQYYLGQWNSVGIAGLIHAPSSPLPVPPFYFWSMMPLLNLMPHNPVAAVLMANWVYLLIIGVSAYLIAKFERMDSCGWTAAAFSTSLPFVLTATHHVSPDIAVMAFSLASVAAYVQSNGFMNYTWTLVYILCVSAGLLSGWHFLIFLVPLVYLCSSASKNWLVQGRAIAGFFVPLLVLAVWLSPNLSSVLNAALSGESWAATKTGMSLGFAGMVFWPLWTAMSGATLLFFLPAMAALFIMMEAELAPYPRRKELYYWLIISAVVVAIVPMKTESLVLPALLVLGPVVGVAAPERFRRPLVAAVMLLALVNQAGCVGPKKVSLAGKKITVLGGELPRHRMFNPDSLAVAAAGVASDTVSASTLLLLPGDLPVSAPELETRVRALGVGRISVLSDADSYIVCPNLVVMTDDYGRNTAFIRDFGSPADPASSFSLLYRPGGMADIGSGRKAFFYFKKAQPVPLYPGAEFVFDRLNFHGAYMDNVRIGLGPYDPATGSYPRSGIAIGHLVWEKASFYGVKLNVTGLSFYVPDPVKRDRIVITGLSSLNIAFAMTTVDNAVPLMTAMMPGFSNIQAVFTPEGMKVSARRMWVDWHFVFFPEITQNPFGLRLKPSFASISFLQLPAVMRGAAAINMRQPDGKFLPFQVSAGPAAFTDTEFTVGKARQAMDGPIKEGEMEIIISEPAQ